MNSNSEERLNGLYPRLSGRAHDLAAMLSFELEIVQGKRSFQLQRTLYAQGRLPTDQVNSLRAGVNLAPLSDSQNVIVTHAQAGYGWHEFGLAFDAAPLITGMIDWNAEHPDWKEMLAKAPGVGLAEGAEFRTFPDNPHFYLAEMPASPDDNIRYLFNENGIQEVWDYVTTNYFG